MPATVINRFGGGMPSSAREDKKALELALQLTMLGFNPYNNGQQHGGGANGPPYRGGTDDRELRRSANMTECVPVPSSEHVAEIVGRQGCKIKALRAKTNTYIKTPVRGEDPVFVVTGRREDVACAKREILSAADHFSQIRATRRGGGGGGGSAGAASATGISAAAAAGPGGLGPAASAALCLTPAAASAATATAIMASSNSACSLSSGALLTGVAATAGLGMCTACKQPADHVTVHVRVPYHVVGLVVGPKGATIKRIQQNTQTYIVTPSRDKEPVFEVTGLADCVEKARQEIEKHIAARTGGGGSNGSSASSSGSESGGSCSGGVADEDDFHCNGVESAYFDEPGCLDAAGLSYGVRCDLGGVGGDGCAAAAAAAAVARDAFTFVAAVDPSSTTAMSDFSLSRLRSGSNSSNGLGCGGSGHGFDRLLDGKGLGKSIGSGTSANVVTGEATTEGTACVGCSSHSNGSNTSSSSSCTRMPFWSESLVSVAGGDVAVGAPGTGGVVVTSLLPGPAAAVGAPLPGKSGVGNATSCRLPSAAPGGGNGQRDRRLAREMACGSGTAASAASALPPLLLLQQQRQSRCGGSGRASPRCSSPAAALDATTCTVPQVGNLTILSYPRVGGTDLPTASYVTDLVARCNM